MSLTTDQLMNQARCIDQCMPDGEKLSALIYIFQQILQNGTGGGGTAGVTSLNTLTGPITLAAGSGVTITPSGNTLTVASTGGSGYQQVTGGVVDPVAAPVNPAVINLYVNTVSGVIWTWPAGGSAWQ
jgi:hypothetical protein